MVMRLFGEYTLSFSVPGIRNVLGKLHRKKTFRSSICVHGRELLSLVTMSSAPVIVMRMHLNNQKLLTDMEDIRIIT